ncbi:MAG: hypothetical protein KC649_02165 [Candidatus Omnitrophica bacterium]|nr:hypothetical protein [Candidatus Omnitrophota bacterium]
MKKFLLTFVICLAAASAVFAQEHSYNDVNEAQNAIESALDFITQDKVEEGLAGLIPYFPIQEDVLEQLLLELNGGHTAAVETLGNSVGFNFIGIRNLRDVMVEITYLERFEKSALRWRFYLYKSSKSWTFHSIQMDGDIPSAMTEWGTALAG